MKVDFKVVRDASLKLSANLQFLPLFSYLKKRNPTILT